MHAHMHSHMHAHVRLHVRTHARAQIVADIQLPLDDYRKDLDEWSGTEEESQSQVISSFEQAESNAMDPKAVISLASSVTSPEAGNSTTTEPDLAAEHRGGTGGGQSDFDGGGGAGGREVLPKKNDRNRHRLDIGRQKTRRTYTRLYFTSESHCHSLINCLRFARRPDGTPLLDEVCACYVLCASAVSECMCV